MNFQVLVIPVCGRLLGNYLWAAVHQSDVVHSASGREGRWERREMGEKGEKGEMAAASRPTVMVETYGGGQGT